MRTNILALDIDGVLNYFSMERKLGYLDLCMDRVALLRRIVWEGSARIVLSSTWRLYAEPRASLVRVFSDYGMYIHDDTPEYGSGTPRNVEILSHVLSRYAPGDFRLAVLDDWISASTETFKIDSKMFLTDPHVGLTAEITDSIINYFGAP